MLTTLTIIHRAFSHSYYSYLNNVDVSKSGIQSSNIYDRNVKEDGPCGFGNMINLLYLFYFNITHI